jgi:hypothetical protein
MASLFPERQPRNSQSLIQFKAGKCELAEIPGTGKYRVTPDKKKGTLGLQRSQDGIVKIVWTDRTQNIAVDDVIVFPDDVVMKKVNTGREGDRVYILKVKFMMNTVK